MAVESHSVRPRILLSSYSNELGGMELRMAAEARLLQESGSEVVLATRRAPPLVPWMKNLRASGIDARFLSVPPAFEQWRWRRANKLLAEVISTRIIQRWRCQLNHIFMPWTDLGGSLLWTSHVARLPVVLSVHNAFPYHRFHPWYDALLAKAYRSVMGVYAVSQSAMDHYLCVFGRYLSPDTICRVIPNFVDTTRFQPSRVRRSEARMHLGISEDALVVGSVGRLSDQKRPEALIRVFSRLTSEFKNLHLVLVGDGPLKDRVTALARSLGLAQCVHITGFRENVEAVIPALDIHMLLSSREGFGIATVEAMACGVPVVGSDVPGTADILRNAEGGILVQMDDDEAIVASVGSLLSSADERIRMGAAARQTAERLYGVTMWSEKIRGFYSDVMSRVEAPSTAALFGEPA